MPYDGPPCILEQRSVFFHKNCSFYHTKRFSITLSFQLMSEVSNKGLEKCKEKYSFKKNEYVRNVYFKEFYW
jgi:hypothetical protein